MGLKGKRQQERSVRARSSQALVAAAAEPKVAANDLNVLSYGCPSCFVQLREVMDNCSIVKKA